MAVVDELVTLIRFDMPADAKRALDGVSKTVRGITDKIKTLGIVSAATSGIMAAWGINAGKAAQDISHLSQSLNINTDEVQKLQSLYTQLGGSASEYAQDAMKYYQATGQALDIDHLEEMADYYSKYGREQAQALLRTGGYSETFIRGILEGADAIRKKTDDMPFADQGSIEQLGILRDEWNKLKTTIEPLSIEIQAAISPLLIDGLKWLKDLLKDNWDDIVETFKWASDGVSSAVEKIKEVFAGIGTALSPFLDKLGGSEKILTSLAVGLGTVAAIAIPAALIGSVTAFVGAVMPISATGIAIAGGIAAIAAALSQLELEDFKEILGIDLEEAWASTVEAVKPIIDNFVGICQSAFTAVSDAISKIDFKGIWEYIKPSDELITSVASVFSAITQSIANLFGTIKKSIDEGAIGRIIESFKEIANSPFVAKILEITKDVREAILGIGFDLPEGGFRVLESVGGSVLPIVEGIFKALSGIVNMDMSKVVEGFQQIGNVLIDLLKDIFTKIIPEISQQILIKLGLMDDPTEKQKKAVNDYGQGTYMQTLTENERQKDQRKYGMFAFALGRNDEQLRKDAETNYAGLIQSGLAYEESQAKSAEDLLPKEHYMPAIPGMAGAASIDGDTNTTNNSSVTYNQTFHVEANGFSPEQIGQAIIGEAQTMSKINDPRVDQSVHR